MNRVDAKEIFKPLSGQSFRFECRPDLQCFGKCCAKLRLILTPYDILRIKHALGVSSEVFLEEYTETMVPKQDRFPMVRLKMDENGSQACPFLTDTGCRIYKDRPVACRLYPIGKASTLVEGETKAREKFFIVEESHCFGFQEGKTWSLERWFADEGVNEYNEMNDPWLRIVTASRSLGNRKDYLRKFQMFFMASYNLDRFRAFLFQSKYFDYFEVTSEMIEALSRDDVALLQHGFAWLRFSLYGEKTLAQRPGTG
jgi:Fe-S-cluster containining protein